MDLDRIQELAELQFSRDEVCLIIGEDFKNDEAAERAYLTGRLLAQSLVRKEILNGAKTGSTTACKQFLELVEQSAIEDEWQD